MDSLSNKVIVNYLENIQFTTQPVFEVDICSYYASVRSVRGRDYHEISKEDRNFFVMGDYAISRVETIENLINEKDNLIKEKDNLIKEKEKDILIKEKEKELLSLKLKM